MAILWKTLYVMGAILLLLHFVFHFEFLSKMGEFFIIMGSFFILFSVVVKRLKK